MPNYKEMDKYNAYKHRRIVLGLSKNKVATLRMNFENVPIKEMMQLLFNAVTV